MSPLHELQRDFMAGIFNRDNDAALAHIAPSELSKARRLAIYRNNVYVGLTHTLQGIYPVIQRLVGEGFFTYAATNYIDHHPSTCGDLNHYGEQFAEFLSGFPPAVELNYLPDVARLEWAYHRVYSAADHPPLNLARLSQVAPDDYGKLTFMLHPAACLIRSDYPISRIWHVNQPGHEGDHAVDLSSGGEKLLVQRQDNTIAIEVLTEIEWALLFNIDRRAPLEAVVDQVLSIDPTTDFSPLLQRYIRQSLLVDISL